MEAHDADAEMVAHYVRELRRGSDQALLSLAEAGREAGPRLTPYLERAYREEDDPRVRAELVHAIRQSRLPAVVPFLEGTLRDPEPDVWHRALDGLVAIPCPEAVTALDRALAEPQGTDKQARERREWIREALDQMHAR